MNLNSGCGEAKVPGSRIRYSRDQERTLVAGTFKAISYCKLLVKNSFFFCHGQSTNKISKTMYIKKMWGFSWKVKSYIRLWWQSYSPYFFDLCLDRIATFQQPRSEIDNLLRRFDQSQRGLLRDRLLSPFDVVCILLSGALWFSSVLLLMVHKSMILLPVKE